MQRWRFVTLILCLYASFAQATGEVSVPLTDYEHLRQAADQSKRSPYGHGISESRVQVTVTAEEQQYQAAISETLTVQTYNDGWVAVPLFSKDIPVKRLLVNGQVGQLSQDQDQWVWLSKNAGTYHLQLEYTVTASATANGYQLDLAMPKQAPSQVQISLPVAHAEVTLSSASNLTISQDGEGSTVQATVSGVDSSRLQWQRSLGEQYVISRANYSAVQNKDALQVTAVYAVEVFHQERIQLPLLPTSTTLQDIRVDDQEAIVLVEDGYFTTLLDGVGKHSVAVDFQVPVTQQDGPPVATFAIPEVPVSYFALQLAGKKEVSVTPTASVSNTFEADQTIASVNLPMSSEVSFTWSEAIPQEVKDELRANASVYHSLYAEEGVLYGTAVVVYDITRGETSSIDLQIPQTAQVNRIEAANGAVSDWRMTEQTGDMKRVTVFLDRKIKGSFSFKLFYERPLESAGAADQAIAVPLLKVSDVHRQRGMVALLSNSELALKPVTAEHLNKVGENQLPAFVRQELNMIVAHTYKYAEEQPNLTVKGVAPERKRGQFDAQVDTLVSIGEVTLKGSATVALEVKSGNLMSVQLKLPKDISVLSLTAPSLRTYKVNPVDGHQMVDVEFTQELEGEFRLALNYEKILSDIGQDTQVPTVSVVDAEVEHGRIAVEALSAVEVQATRHEQLSSVDVNELPQQLVLKTTNPILLAYRYVHVDPPYQLALKVTRHQELDVQVATIEQADYKTLLTNDGLAVTTANFRIKNSRKQFLRLQLPKQAEVWSVFVDGVAEKPAKASDDDSSVLIKLKNSTQGFSLQVVYAVQQAALEGRGDVRMILPRPDMVVTHSEWAMYLPEGHLYRVSDSNMEQGGDAIPASFDSKILAQQPGAIQVNVPTQGIQFSFHKLYANQTDQDTYVLLAYEPVDSTWQGSVLSVLGVLLLGFVAMQLFASHTGSRWLMLGLTLFGMGCVGVALWMLHSSALPAAATAMLLFVLALVKHWRNR